jgi:hypothetical protein
VFLLKATREQLVRLLPPDGVGLEIGVAEGDFAAVLLANANPRQLHLVDPWEHQDSESYRPDTNNVGPEEANLRHSRVVDRFSGEISAGRIVMHRSYSHDEASRFPDETFDWIYIDGAHYFEACARDLALYGPKVKAGGLILGHDYAASAAARAMKFGVVEAVNQFVESGQAEMLILTYEQFPTYVLTKRPVSSAAHSFVGSAILSFDVAAEIRRPEGKRFDQYIATIHHDSGPPVERLILAFE